MVRNVDKISKNNYDLIIVGGGIYGATLLWEATSRGLSAILVEKGDFCGGTSANSLKIIHGGLRYLQNLEIKRMRQSIAERKRLMKIAPHLVHPLAFVTPTYSDLPKSKFAFWLAFKLNELVSFDCNFGMERDKKIPAGKIVSAEKCSELIPALDSSNITGGALWHDGQVYNSERLVLSFILSSLEKGADALNYLEMESPLFSNGKVIGIRVNDLLSNQQTEIFANTMVDCTGPWINTPVRRLDSCSSRKTLKFAKAVNIIIPRILSSYAFGLGVERGDGYGEDARRLLFFVPWRDTTIIGTWYFPDSCSPDEVYLKESELQYCLDDIKLVLPDVNFTADEITNIHLGMVPAEYSLSANQGIDLSRKYSIIDYSRNGGPDGAISVQGVKYTTARDIAEKTIHLLAKKLKKKLPRISPPDEPIYGGDIGEFGTFLNKAIYDNTLSLTPQTIKHLVSNYGSKHSAILDYVSRDKDLAELVPGSKEVIKAELVYSIKEELTYNLSDLLLRRTDIGSAAKPSLETVKYCTDLMAEELSWDQREKQSQMDDFLGIYDRVRL